MSAEYTMPCLWRIHNDYPLDQLGQYEGPDRFLFLAGRPIEGALTATPVVKFDNRRADICSYDCLWTAGRLPLVNDRLRRSLEEHIPGKVQFFDVRIISKDGEVFGYAVLNAAKLINVIDVARSEYSLFPNSFDGIMSFKSIKI